jgi:hypothetical protein
MILAQLVKSWNLSSNEQLLIVGVRGLQKYFKSDVALFVKKVEALEQLAESVQDASAKQLSTGQRRLVYNFAMTTDYSATFAESVVTWADLIAKVMDRSDGVFHRLQRLQDLVYEFLSSVKPSKGPTGVEASTFELPQGVPDNDPAFVSLLKRNASVLDETTPVSRDRQAAGKKVRRTGDGEIDNDEFANADDEDLDVGTTYRKPRGDDLAASEFEMMQSFVASYEMSIDLSVYSADPFLLYKDIKSAGAMGYDSRRNDWDTDDYGVLSRLVSCFRPNPTLEQPSQFPKFYTALQKFYHNLLQFRDQNDAGLTELDDTLKTGFGFRRKKRVVRKKVVRGGSFVKL